MAAVSIPIFLASAREPLKLDIFSITNATVVGRESMVTAAESPQAMPSAVRHARVDTFAPVTAATTPSPLLLDANLERRQRAAATVPSPSVRAASYRSNTKPMAHRDSTAGFLAAITLAVLMISVVALCVSQPEPRATRSAAIAAAPPAPVGSFVPQYPVVSPTLTAMQLVAPPVMMAASPTTTTVAAAPAAPAPRAARHHKKGKSR